MIIESMGIKERRIKDQLRVKPVEMRKEQPSHLKSSQNQERNASTCLQNIQFESNPKVVVFGSKIGYSSGFFHKHIKLPRNNDTYAVLPTFYLKSQASNSDEIDFEFFENDHGSFILSTNIFTQGNGGREQEFSLWFDPTIDFHSYAILWNTKQIG
ncbi:hypothetical protein CRG98_029841 [Punica granatum]|uniref:GH16 domain-containing protein n=1 Tax=Punica granatum TaxID=22663 RepID=A0A2I0J0P5_PUNGR|nr:hypothetical protein CRG98_029841 [Punica granatum]